MKTHRPSEKGQILVLLALVLVGLLGFTALAVDGGMIYADRRYMQSSADASTIAGAGDIGTYIDTQSSITINCSDPNLIAKINQGYTTTINTASANDFTIVKTTGLGSSGNNNGVLITCTENYVDVFVMLTRDTKTSFVQLFTGNPMRNTVSSVTRVEPRTTAGNGSSIVSLSKTCKKNSEGGYFSGNNTTILTNGGIWSNSCIEAGGSSDVQVDGGSIDYYYTSHVTGLSDPIPTPQKEYHLMTTDPFTSWTWECPTPSHAPVDQTVTFKLPNGDSVTEIRKVFAPGSYSGKWTVKDKVFLEPGLYCISGTVDDNTATDIYGKDITILFTGDKFQFNAQAKTVLLAPNDKTDPLPQGIKADRLNILFYSRDGSVVTINGGSDNYFAGTIYAPKALVTINGNSGTRNMPASDVSIIGYGVKIVGNSTVNLKYDPNLDWGQPAYIQVQK